MKGWHFAFSRRWLGYLAFAIIFAIACVFLSNWQLARAHETAAENARIADNYDDTPVPLADALPTLTSYQPNQEWSRVSVNGHYLSDDQLLVRNRPLRGTPGFEVLTPLQLSDGTIFVIDRGWVPTGTHQDKPDRVPPAPTGQVRVVARLKAGEPRFNNRTAPKGEIPTIELHDIRAAIGGAVHTSAYGLLNTETPAPATRPAPLERPAEDVGLHWSYMIQWLIFAAIGFFGLGYGLRQEYLNINSEDPEVRAKAAERERKHTLKQTDADVEDEILDDAGR